mmetsp:Transcript_4241/g.9237  ORF Transcript_4241/g.9237 Transcript_4241/m.9237 type:complete len:305 (-) Transcript_4241:584-1498(-)
MPGDTAGAPGARLRSWESLCSSWHLIPAPLYPSLLSSCRHHFHSFCSTIYAATGPAHAAPGSIPAAESAAPAAQGAAPAGTCRSRPYRCLLASKRCDGEVDTADQVAGALLVAAECEGEDGVRVGGCEVASLAEGDGGGVDDGSGGVEVLHGVDEHQTIGQVGGEHRVALDGLEGGLTPVVDAVAHLSHADPRVAPLVVHVVGVGGGHVPDDTDAVAVNCHRTAVVDTRVRCTAAVGVAASLPEVWQARARARVVALDCDRKHRAASAPSHVVTNICDGEGVIMQGHALSCPCVVEVAARGSQD